MSRHSCYSKISFASSLHFKLQTHCNFSLITRYPRYLYTFKVLFLQLYHFISISQFPIWFSTQQKRETRKPLVLTSLYNSNIHFNIIPLAISHIITGKFSPCSCFLKRQHSCYLNLRIHIFGFIKLLT